MCFSATASFGASVLLTGAAVVASRQVRDPKQRAFALVPLIFAIQQFSEGWVWLSLSHGAYAEVRVAATTVFMVFAELVWPVWIPLAVLLLEKDRWRRQILRTLLGIGLGLMVPTIYYLMHYPIDAQISRHHIEYLPHFPFAWLVFRGFAYGFAAVLPFFISSYPRMWLMGVPNSIAFLVAKVFFSNYVISIWCYFAAIISVVVVYILYKARNVQAQNEGN